MLAGSWHSAGDRRTSFLLPRRPREERSDQTNERTFVEFTLMFGPTRSITILDPLPVACERNRSFIHIGASERDGLGV